MKKVFVAIILATLFMIVYQLSPFIGIPGWMILIMFLFSPVVVVSMVYVILKYGVPSKHTFDERFYDDWDYKRNIVEKDNAK